MSEPQIFIAEQWQSVLAGMGLTDYESFMTLEIGQQLIKAGLGDRQRIKIDLPEIFDGPISTIFLKRYGHSGPEIIERDAIATIRAAGINTMETIACGSGDRGGFIAVTAVAGRAMFDCFDELRSSRSDSDTLLTDELPRQLGEMAADLHNAGLTHRDFYTTHIFIDIRDEKLTLSLIDLARVFAPRRFMYKWITKDLAQLKFSLPGHWCEKHWPAIIASYLRGRKLKRLPPFAASVIDIRARAMDRSYRRRMKRRQRSKSQ